MKNFTFKLLRILSTILASLAIISFALNLVMYATGMSGAFGGPAVRKSTSLQLLSLHFFSIIGLIILIIRYLIVAIIRNEERDQLLRSFDNDPEVSRSRKRE